MHERLLAPLTLFVRIVVPASVGGGAIDFAPSSANNNVTWRVYITSKTLSTNVEKR